MKKIDSDFPHDVYRQLLDAAPDAMVAVDDATGRIAFVNGQAEVLFGYDRTELIGEPVEVLVPERFRSTHGELRTDVKDPRPRPMGSGLDLTGKHKNGTEIPIEVSLSPLRTSQVSMVSATIRDVSERRKYLEELRVKTELIERQMQVIRDLGMPIVPLAEGVLLLTLIGTVDSTQAARVTAELLNAVSRERARHVIIDLTKIGVLDTAVAANLLTLTQAIKLLGSKTFLTGISPVVAQTMVAVETRLETLVTLGSVAEALRVCMGTKTS